MSDTDDIKIIEIAEICRVEGHSAVRVEIRNKEVHSVKLEIFEGARFFEKIVIGHNYNELPHITSRVCAICSTGHVLAAIYSIENLAKFKSTELIILLRELMHLGMIIESHSTHIYALALPDLIKVGTIGSLAQNYPKEFGDWLFLRDFGATIQTIIGGRPFHPVNLLVGGFSKLPDLEKLFALESKLDIALQKALDLCQLLLKFKPLNSRSSKPLFLALIPEKQNYSYFGHKIRSSDGWEASVDDYKNYLQEYIVPYSHAKQSKAKGKILMVGAMARLYLYSHLLTQEASNVFKMSPFNEKDTNSYWNNLAQAIEIVSSLETIKLIINKLRSLDKNSLLNSYFKKIKRKSGASTGAVECPRGTLYHFYNIDLDGKVLEADMITPSAQNSACIEQDIKEIAQNNLCDRDDSAQIEATLSLQLETLIRAYDPCNTCATHMLDLKFIK